ncbi:mycothiol synthase [Sphaerisporangium sp. TRM90804]|uniref:mycothiol synthase n=1 Tax=Sphaerisporangium sp. TRM90804 TaxID=3031113 RepID=UPI00244874FC|nr:mycothiol synthase [Sphaerisporangium sp. TRM90804]MDH2426946.1 mycothiol synthase [Sphaerisporangium sp. TRM90804]
MNVRVDIRDRLADREVAAVVALVDSATEADSVKPLNEHVMLHLRYGGDPGAKAVLLYDGDDLVGFAHIDPTDQVEGPSGELVIHPAFRRRGLGRKLLEATLAEAGGRLRLWAHGDHTAAGHLASSLGFTRVRSLWQMRRSLSEAVPGAEMPPGIRLRTFEPGADEEAWLRLNARAFAHHPEQGAWTLDDLTRREQEPWFDPAGFFLAVRETPRTDVPADPGAPAGPDGGRPLAGFHWTKVHGDEDHDSHGHNAIGEVYVVGVDPTERGSGLGRALTLAGLAHLRSRGLPEVMLYVDEDNPSAIRLYEGLGFTRWDVDVMYRHR